MSSLWGEVSEVIDMGGLFPGVISRPITVREAIGMDGSYTNSSFKWLRKNNAPFQTLTKTKAKSHIVFNENGDRYLIQKELSSAGSYPVCFVFTSFEDAIRRVGNSVPPLLMKAIATQIYHKLWKGDPLIRYPKTMTYPEILEAAWQDHLAPRDPNAPTVISTFAGGGGSSLGYSMAGYRELLAVEWDDNAVATFKLNFLDVPVYHGDIAKLSVEECMELAGVKEGELFLLDGSPPCFPENMLIQAECGKIPIGFCTVGQKVLTHTGNYREITEVFERDYDKPLLEIETKYGRKSVVCTQEHPIFARKRSSKLVDSPTGKRRYRKKTYLDPEWIEAKDLKIGDVILEPHVKDVLPLNIPKVVTKQRVNIKGVSGIEQSELRLFERDCNIDWHTKEIAWILGFYLAEGHTRGHNPTLDIKGPCRREVIFSIADKETVFIVDKLLELGLKPQAQKHSKGSTRVTVISIGFWVLCDNTMGKYADGKFIPPAFMTMPVDWQKSLLDGYFFGDGCIRKHIKNNSITQKATTVSWDLATGIAKMIAKVYRVVAGIEILYPAGKAEIEGRQVNVKETYSVGYRLPTPNKVRPGFVDEYGSWLPIKSIKELSSEKTKVYNLEVDEDHSYTANDFAVHNCQGVSTAGKRDLNDPRNQLFREFVRLLRGLKPKVFVMENVPGLVKGKMKLIFAEIMRELKASGYQVLCKKLNAMYFYVPQSRERLIFIGVRNNLATESPFPSAISRPITVRKALEGVTTINILSDMQKDMWAKMRPGQSGSQVHPKGHWFNFMKLDPNKPAPMVAKEAGNAKHCYWAKPFGLSIDGYKRISSFPDPFNFIGSYGNKKNRIGNSVPPLFVRALAINLTSGLNFTVSAGTS